MMKYKTPTESEICGNGWNQSTFKATHQLCLTAKKGLKSVHTLPSYMSPSS